MTNELPLIHRALVKAGVPIMTGQRVTAFDGAELTLDDIFGGVTKTIGCRSLVIVGIRQPRDELYQALLARGADVEQAGIASLRLIGDASAPGAIVHAVHSGHRYARELEAPPGAMPYRRDFPV